MNTLIWTESLPLSLYNATTRCYYCLPAGYYSGLNKTDQNRWKRRKPNWLSVVVAAASAAAAAITLIAERN